MRLSLVVVEEAVSTAGGAVLDVVADDDHAVVAVIVRAELSHDVTLSGVACVKVTPGEALLLHFKNQYIYRLYVNTFLQKCKILVLKQVFRSERLSQCRRLVC